jgi:hypothetical protein
MRSIAFILCIPFSVFSQLFTEVSDQVGMVYRYPGNEFQMAGGGLMVIDVNNDGWEDIYQCGSVFDSKLWVNDQGHFSDQTKEFGLGVLSGYFTQGAISADFDNDGYQDFIVANYGKGLQRGDKKSPVLLHNKKGKRFEAIYLDSLLPPAYYSSACVGDFNKDGYTDVYLTNYLSAMGELSDSSNNVIGYNPSCYENKLLLNINGTSFRECANEYGLDNAGCGLSAQFTDIDGDNDLDLLLLNDFGMWNGLTNRCYRNDFPESGFTDISNEIAFNHSMYGMGIGPGDYNNDGSVEYFITNIGENKLLHFDSLNVRDMASTLSVDAPYVKDTVRSTSWSGLFFDMEFDGDLDLFVSRGNVAVLVPRTALSDPNKLYRNVNNGFEDVSARSGVSDRLSHRGSVILDFDHDGDLDIISNVVKMPWVAFAQEEQKIKVFQNNQKAGNWIGILLKGEEGVNADCFGCSVTFEQGDKELKMNVDGGSGHASQSTRILYYGLAKSSKIDAVHVNWGNGKYCTYKSLKSNAVYSISQEGLPVRIR